MLPVSYVKSTCCIDYIVDFYTRTNSADNLEQFIYITLKMAISLGHCLEDIYLAVC